MAAQWILIAAALAWSDPSPHHTRFVEVEQGVRLELLDWGGSGRPLLLLAGSGNTAHVFDEFAPKLKGLAHVYGVTRRGYGASSQPASGYDDQRLADDILAVLKALKLKRTVLVGHSMAGGELTTLGNQHSDKLAGLVYLDALGDPRDWPGSDPAYLALAAKLPPGPPPGETPRTVAEYRARQMRVEGFAFPESELRNAMVVDADGNMGTHKTPPAIHNAIGAGQKKRDYSGIRVPVLALFDFPRVNEAADEATRAFNVATKAYVDRWVADLTRSVPAAQFFDTRDAGHYIFLKREAETLRRMQIFVKALR